MDKIRSFFLKAKADGILAYARAHGYSFRQARTDADKKAAAKLRFDVYASEGYIDPLNHPGRELTDRYAPFSEDFLAFHHSLPVGTIRVTRDSEYGFPTENLFNIAKLEDRASVLEAGRLVIELGYRQKKKEDRLIMFGLAYMALRYSLRSGIRYWVANMPEKLAHSFEQFGARPEPLPQQEPTAAHIGARDIIKGYFKQYDLLPYKVDVSAMLREGRARIKK